MHLEKTTVMKKIITILSLIILLSPCYAKNKPKDIVLSKQGSTKYHIIIPTQPTDNEIYAAQTLQEYIYKISGAKIPIVNKCRKTHKEEIHIGKTNAYVFENELSDAVNVKRKGNSLYFYGSTDVWTMYSVIDFMEKYLGVRQFTDDCDYYPTDSNLTLKNFSSYTYQPVNKYRNVNSNFVKRSKNLKRWLRLNTTDDMFANGFFVHTILKLCSPQEYFDTHSEYFALINGQRDRRQVCWTNEKVFDIVKENLASAMIIQPDKIVWSVSQEDNDIVCHCEKCQALIDKHKSEAAPVIYFINKIAKQFPDKIISTLAYRFSRKCPENLSVENNVQIMLCSIEADRNKTIEEQGKSSGSFAYDMSQWGKITENIFLWDYECDFDYYMCPFPNLHTLQPNIQFFVANNAFQHFQQANCDNGHEFAELKNYLIAQLLWNPNINTDSVIDEFCRNYYGNAGSIVKDYINDIENSAISMKNDVFLDIYGSPVKYKDNLLTWERLRRWSHIFDIAQYKVQNDSISLQRVKTARLSVDYAMMEIAKTDMYGTDGWFEKVDNHWVVKKDMAQRLENFREVCSFADVKDLSEKGLTPEQYYQTTKRMINSDLSSNLAFKKRVTADVLPSPLYSNGRLETLTDGVIGSDDYKMLWIGWWGDDVVLDVDLEQITNDKQITISSLAKPASWILHPLSVECQISKDNAKWISLGTQNGDGLNRNNPVTKEFAFNSQGDFRYIRFIVKGTKTLPSWHHCYTQKSWFFLDEIIVK